MFYLVINALDLVEERLGAEHLGVVLLEVDTLVV